jgi:hypothetical protein
MQPSTAAGTLGVALIFLGSVLVVSYVVAPFMLYGIFMRLGRLIALQERTNEHLLRISAERHPLDGFQRPAESTSRRIE